MVAVGDTAGDVRAGRVVDVVVDGAGAVVDDAAVGTELTAAMVVVVVGRAGAITGALAIGWDDEHPASPATVGARTASKNRPCRSKCPTPKSYKPRPGG